MSCLLGNACETPEGQKCKEVCCDHYTQHFMVKKVGEDKYLHSDIDSSGMSVVLSGKEHADVYLDPDTAASMVRRCSERYSDTRLEVVPC